MSVQVEIHKFRSVIEPKKICKGHIADILLFNCERLSPISARLRHLPRLFRCSVAKCCETRANLKTEEKKTPARIAICSTLLLLLVLLPLQLLLPLENLRFPFVVPKIQVILCWRIQFSGCCSYNFGYEKQYCIHIWQLFL